MGDRSDSKALTAVCLVHNHILNMSHAPRVVDELVVHQQGGGGHNPLSCAVLQDEDRVRGDGVHQSHTILELGLCHLPNCGESLQQFQKALVEVSLLQQTQHQLSGAFLSGSESPK